MRPLLVRSGATMLLLLLLRTGVAKADCRVTAHGEPVGSLRHRATWLRAENELMRSPRVAAAAECANIELSFDENEAATSGVRMVVRMRDDRRAERVVANPDELVPTALMLLTTTTAGAETTDEDPVFDKKNHETETDPPLPLPSSLPPKEKLLAPPAPRETITFGLQGGVRGGADALASPTAQAFASLTLRRWEAGILGGADAGYQSFDFGHERDMRMKGSSMNAGAFIGRREPAGAVFEFFYGGRAVLAFVTGYSRVQTRTGRLEMTTRDADTELRTGAYVGTAFPRKLPVRFRTDLAFDVVPSLGGRSDDEVAGAKTLPITPWWTACLQLGLEIAR